MQLMQQIQDTGRHQRQAQAYAEVEFSFLEVRLKVLFF